DWKPSSFGSARVACLLTVLSTLIMHGTQLLPSLLYSLDERRSASVCDIDYGGPGAWTKGAIILLGCASVALPWLAQRRALLRLPRRLVPVLDASGPGDYRSAPMTTWRVWSLEAIPPDIARRCAARTCLATALLAVAHWHVFLDESPVHAFGYPTCHWWFPD